MPENKTPPQAPVSSGTNALPLDESIAQTESGIPDDSSHPIEISDEEQKAIEKKIRDL